MTDEATMRARNFSARRKTSRPEVWAVLWRVTMPAVRDYDNDWIWEETEDEATARRRCTTLRRCGWPVRLERLQQQPLMPSGRQRIEMMRAQHEQRQQNTPAH